MFAFTSFNCRVPRHLGGHVGVDADGWEHGEVEQEVPACEENQGGREGPGHKQDLDNRVGRFHVCVSDFFHLLNLGVCYREKNGKIF